MTKLGRSFVIVGAGECGVRAAHALRENGCDGAITLIGEERHLPYERPPLSKDAMTAEVFPGPKTISTMEALAAADIECLPGHACLAIDRGAQRVHLSRGGSLPYDRLLIATGAQPRRLPLADSVAGHLRYLRTHEDALRLRADFDAGRSLIIMGGGFIGLELASSARRRGVPVTLIEAQPRLLTRGVPEEIATVVSDKHRDHGVDLFCGVGIATIEAGDSGVRVTLTDDRVVEADALVAGIGAVPNSSLAGKAGLALDNGIAVDETLQTSDPAIFAAGDCCSCPHPLFSGRRIRLEAWRNAQDQGNLVARNMLGAGNAVSAVPWFWSDQYEMSLQITGLAEGAVAVVRRDLGEGAFVLFHLDEAGRLLSASGIGTGNMVARDIRLAEMLIARRARPDPDELASPDVKLKKLLSG